MPKTTLKNTSRFPSTRFQGSKVKLLEWLWEAMEDIPFTTVLDAFGGTGSVGYFLKQKGKQVTYNDKLLFNTLIGRALIENNTVCLANTEIDWLLAHPEDESYPSWIQETFADIYYPHEENIWLDKTVSRIRQLSCPYKQALAYFALFQSCLIKRPFNLFHRKNLYIRFADIKRTFGNKATWDTPFEVHFRKFAEQANAAIIDNGCTHQAFNQDIFDLDTHYDLVYLDPPYIRQSGAGVNYLDFYHFLEGLADYDNWPQRVDYQTKHRRLQREQSVWTDKRNIDNAFRDVFKKFKNSIIVVSYRCDGIPSIDTLETLLKQYKTQVKIHTRQPYHYALSDRTSEEVLLIGF